MTGDEVLDEARDSVDTLTHCVMNGKAYAEPIEVLMAFARAHEDLLDDWLFDREASDEL